MRAGFQNLDRLHLPPQPRDAWQHLVRVLCALVEDYGAQKIIAFGSCVRGSVDEHSDVDLCVIREHPPGCTHPGLDVETCVGKVRPRISTDILVRTPDQWRTAQQAPFGVMCEVIQHGLTVYER
jgi:predicted nucleotidyltransferase